VQSYLNIGNIGISEPIATPPDTHMPTDDLLLLFFLAAFYIFFRFAFSLNSFWGRTSIYLFGCICFPSCQAFLMEIKRNLIESEIITPAAQEGVVFGPGS